MRPFAGRRVLLGVTGGIASYKAVHVARLLQQAGAEVDVVMTDSACEFVGPITFEAVTGRPVHTSLLGAGHALDHIRLARAADAIVVAPATADFCARAAQGRADDLLAACLLAASCPVLVAPAMNDRMWAHPATVANAARLRQIGYRVLDPDDGPLAVGEGNGPGRLPEPEAVLAHIGRLLEPPTLAGLRVIVTAGPTREPLDPVRYITNESSGRMGVALAAAAWRRGADVTLVHGPLAVPLPAGPEPVAVTTTLQMADAVGVRLPRAHVLLMAAAPADFGAADVATRKIKKSDSPTHVVLAPTPDVLRETAARRSPGTTVVGFALETNDLLANARAKLDAKQLHLVVANDATEAGAGFGVDTNRVTLVDADGDEPLPLMSKADVADAILDRVERLRRAR